MLLLGKTGENPILCIFGEVKLFLAIPGGLAMYTEIAKKLNEKNEKKIEVHFSRKKGASGRALGAPEETPDFSRAIKGQRIEHGFSLEKLSELTGINKQTLHSIENYSIKNPSFGNIERIAAALSMNLNDLLLLARGEFRGNLFKTSAAQRWSASFEAEKGFSIYAYSPPSAGQRDFFVGVMTIKGSKKLRHWQLTSKSKACVQPWEGDLLFVYHGMNWRREERVLANETLYFDASIPHTFENLSAKSNRVLLVTYPSIF